MAALFDHTVGDRQSSIADLLGVEHTGVNIRNTGKALFLWAIVHAVVAHVRSRTGDPAIPHCM